MSQLLETDTYEDDRLLLTLKDRQLRTLFETTLDAIAIADDEGRYLDMNPAACKLFGLERDELLGLSIANFAEPGFDFRAEWEKFQGQKKMRGEFPLVRADGERRVVEYAATANFLPYRHLLVMCDITDRKRAEEQVYELTEQLGGRVSESLQELRKTQAQLQESQQRLDNILNSVEEVVWSIHPVTFETIYINPPVKKIFGYSGADFVANPHLWFDVVHPEDKYLITNAFANLSRHRKTRTEYRIVRKDGQVRHISVKSYLILDETGKAIRIDGTTTDITDRLDTKNLLENVFRHVPGAVYQLRRRPDGTFHFPYASAGLKATCGVTPEAVQEDATKAFAFIHEDDHDRVVQSVMESAANLTPWYCEYRTCLLMEGRVIWVLGHATPQRETDGSTIWYGYIREITDKKQAEAQLQQQKEKYRAIVQQAAVGIKQADLSGRLLQVNPGFCQLLGYTKAELLALNLQDITHPDDRARSLECLHQLYAGEIETLNLEKRFLHKDGHTVWTTTALSLLRDTAGEPISDLGIVQDISDRKIAESELEQFFNLALDLLCIADLSGHFRRLNQAWENTLGYSVEELEGRCFLDFVHSEDIAPTLGVMSELREQNPVLQFTNRYLAKDGTYRYIEWRSIPYGNLIYAAARDITDRKRTELALAESEAQNRAILQAIPDIMFRVSRDGIYLSYTGSPELLGFQDGEESIGKNMAEYLPPDLYQRQQHYMELALETRQIQIYEHEVTLARCVQQEEVRVVPLEDREELLFMIRDISDRKQAELENIKTQNFLNSIIENIPNMVFVKDAETLNFVRFNKAGEELLGYPREALLGKSDYDFFPPEEADFFVDKDREVLASGQVLDIPEEQIQTSSQDMRILHTRKIPILDESGNPQYLLGISEDITDLKKSAARLLEVLQLQQAILDGANYAIIATDPEGIIKVFNPAAETTLGYSSAEVVDKLSPAIFHDLAEIQQRAADLSIELGRPIPPGFEVFIAKAQLGMTDEYEWTYIRKDGSQLPVELSVTALRDESGTITGFLGIAKDIGDRKRAEAALAESEAQNRAILQAIPDIMFRVNESGIYLGYSESTELFDSLGNKQSVGRSMADYLPPELYQRHRHYMAIALETGQTQIYEQEVTIAGRIQYEEVRVVPLENQGELLFMIRDIGDRKRAEAALAESEAQNRIILQAIPDIMFRVNKAGIYLAYSTSVEFLDLSDPQSVGKPMADDLSPEHYQRHMSHLAIALETGRTQIYEQEVTIEGHLQYEEVRVIPLDNREEGLFMIRDIGDRKRAEADRQEAEENLRQNEQKYHQILDAITDMVLVKGPQSCIMWANKAFRDYYALTNEQLKDMVDAPFNEPDYTLQYIRDDAYVFETGQSLETEEPVTRYDGHVQMFNTIKSVIRNEAGEKILTVGVSRDITDRKRQEQAFRLIVEGTAAKTGEEFFKSCVQYLAQVLDVRYAFIAEFADSEKTIATTLAFWAGDDFSNNFIYSIQGSPAEHSLGEFCLYPNAVQSLFPEDIDLVTLEVESYAGLPILDDQGNALGLLVVMDTKPMVQDTETQSAILKIFATRAGAEIERLQAEAAVRRSELQLRLKSTELETTLKKLQSTQTQLIQAEKMSGLGQLVAGIAHEINNPVGFILGNLKPAKDYASRFIELIQLYQAHYPSPPGVISDFQEDIDLEYIVPDFSSLLKSIETGATRIQDIVKSLRTFSRLDETGLKAIDLHESIDSTLAVLQSRLNGRTGNLEVHITKNYDDLPLVEAHGSLLNQVFMNLLANALDAIEQQRESLEPTEKSNYQSRITITTSTVSNNQVLISIQDNGCGMSPEVEEKIFNPFFTTKPVGKGTGMGLATSYQIIEEQHQGRISVNSTPGEGTEFILVLPIKQ